MYRYFEIPFNLLLQCGYITLQYSHRELVSVKVLHILAYVGVEHPGNQAL